jgi:glycosyltransferase involved in cell wall biosynthesis
LRVLILHRKDITNLEAGGGTAYIHRAAKYLVERGHKVTIICANYPGGKKEENIDGVTISRTGTKDSVFFVVPVQLIRKFRKKVDVIIDVINGPPWFSSLYSNTPKIVLLLQSFREIFLVELNKPLASILCSMEKLIPYVYHNTPLITLSPSVQKDLVDMGFPERNIFVVPPGIDQEKYGPGEKSNLSLVLYVGRLKKYKGLEYLIMAMREVVKEVRNAKLFIVGKGDYANKLVSLANRLKLGKTVKFCGYVSEERKVELMRKAHVIVVPSIKEGWGIPIIEAAACGTPAVGTDTTGLRDSIINGKTGFLVPYAEPKVLAKRIAEILKNDDLRHRLSKNAVDWARNFDWNRGLRNFETIVTTIGEDSMDRTGS